MLLLGSHAQQHNRACNIPAFTVHTAAAAAAADSVGDNVVRPVQFGVQVSIVFMVPQFTHSLEQKPDVHWALFEEDSTTKMIIIHNNVTT